MAPQKGKGLESFILDRRICVCVGSGGVGKTTVSAVIALHAALMGRKVLVLTIDPAKRLANSLGVSELDNEERRIPLDDFTKASEGEKGQFWAMMLDMKRSFDMLVERYAPDEKTVEKIYSNRLYKYFSTSMAGTQEYSAMERLHHLYESGKYDLIVLDTPPTAHALDFLDAPNRMAEAVETSALQWLYKPSLAARKFGFGLFNIGTSYVLKTLTKFTGGEMIEELREFLFNFRYLFEGFRVRARKVREVLGSDEAVFFIVTSPDPMTVDEARFFRDRLSEEEIPFGGYVVNRVHAPYVDRDVLDSDPEKLANRLAEKVAGPSQQSLERLSRSLLRNVDEFQILADLDA
jgi:anion-transporting  ArsA/GET3 family ATPase